jgi:hypothetical protein
VIEAPVSQQVGTLCINYACKYAILNTISTGVFMLQILPASPCASDACSYFIRHQILTQLCLCYLLTQACLRKNSNVFRVFAT